MIAPRLQRRDRFGEHLLIELVADFADVTGLLLAQQISGAANVEIVRGEFKAGAEAVERLQHFQSPLGLRRHGLVGRHRQDRVGARLRTADAPAQLIKLRQPEAVGTVHDQRVGGRNIEARLDNGRRHEHVEFSLVEGAHDVFELARRHLAVGDGKAHLRHVLFEKLPDAGDVLDARTDVKRLPSPVAFAQQRLAHHERIERRDEGAHRQAVDRRRRDDRQFAHARERQRQRARDRRRGERQDVHFVPELLQPFLVGDAEMLLLVDDDEAEILEFNGLREQRVGADHDVDRAFREPFPHLRHLAGGNEP